MSLSHLAPFVDVSRQKYIREIKNENESAGVDMTDEQIRSIAEIRVKKEIKDSVQTLNYQWFTNTSWPLNRVNLAQGCL